MEYVIDCRMHNGEVRNGAALRAPAGIDFA